MKFTRAHLNLIILQIAPCTADFARMKEHRQRWESTVVEWKDLICKLTLNQFISFMDSSEVVSPPELERQRRLLAGEQAAVNRRREELLQQMAGFRPPITTKAAVYEWKEDVEKLNQQLGRYMHLTHQGATLVESLEIDVIVVLFQR